MESQQVVLGKAEAADGWFGLQTTVQAMAVVALKPSMAHTLKTPVCAMDDVPFLPQLGVGSRVRMKSSGKYSRGLEGRTGMVLGFGHTKSAVRVHLDVQKSPQTLHRGYLRLISDPGP